MHKTDDKETYKDRNGDYDTLSYKKLKMVKDLKHPRIFNAEQVGPEKFPLNTSFGSFISLDK